MSIFKKHDSEPVSIDPTDAQAVVHEREVLARENAEAQAGHYTSPTPIGAEAIESVTTGPRVKTFVGVNSPGYIPGNSNGLLNVNIVAEANLFNGDKPPGDKQYD